MTAHRAGLDRLKHWRVTVPKDRLIYDEGETPLAFYRVETGCVRLQVTRDDGRRQILAFCLPGDVFGIEVKAVRSAAAEAAIASELTRFPTISITATALESRCVMSLISATADMIATLSVHLKGIGHASADDRLMWFLDWLAHRQKVKQLGGVVQPPMSRRDIADFLGMAEETLSRTFARLESQRHIRVINHRRILLNPTSPPQRASTSDVVLHSPP